MQVERKLHGLRQTGVRLPQGAVKSPDLFNPYTIDLKNVSDVEIKYLQLADDIILYTRVETVEHVVSQLNRGMERCSQWCQASGFTVS